MGTFLEAFRSQAGPGRTLRFDRFVELALYHPELGYYRRQRQRVGTGPDTDFYTASHSAPVFGEIILAAIGQLLNGEDLSRYTFVEIGAEIPGGVLAGIAHPFGAARTVRVGELFAVEGRCVVFSNELFDAQPFRRFRVRGELGGNWGSGPATRLSKKSNFPPLCRIFCLPARPKAIIWMRPRRRWHWPPASRGEAGRDCFSPAIMAKAGTNWRTSPPLAPPGLIGVIASPTTCWPIPVSRI